MKELKIRSFSRIHVTNKAVIRSDPCPDCKPKAASGPAKAGTVAAQKRGTAKRP